MGDTSNLHLRPRGADSLGLSQSRCRKGGKADAPEQPHSPRAGPGFPREHLPRGRPRWSQRPPPPPAARGNTRFQRGDRPLAATAGRKATGPCPSPHRFLRFLIPLCPRSPLFSDRDAGGNKRFESKRRNAEGQGFRNTATQECYSFK